MTASSSAGICKYCKHDILWVDRKPFELDGQTRHAFDVCAQKRKSSKSEKRKKDRLEKKEAFERGQAKFPVGSYIITYVERFKTNERYVPVGVVVAHTKFKSKYTAPLVVKRIGHGDHEEHMGLGGEFAKVVTQEKYREILKAEINRHTALIAAYKRTLGSEYLEEQIYKRSHHLGDGSPRDLSDPEFFWDRLYLETAKKCLEEKSAFAQ
jgi:hypothetical protein